MLRYLLCFYLMMHYSVGNGTTIIPFPNLYEMGMASDAVAVIRIDSNYESDSRLIFSGQVIESIMGELATRISIQNMVIKTGEFTRTVSGDVDFQSGQRYLVFLKKTSSGYWQPLMLSHAIFIMASKDNQDWFVPIEDQITFEKVARPDQRRIEPLHVISCASANKYA